MSSERSKSVLREMVLARRDAMEEGLRIALSRKIIRRITALTAYRQARVVLAYASFGSELKTGDFLRSVLEEGKTLVLPRVDRARKLLDLYEVKDLEEDLEAGVWGIREPAAGRCRPASLGAVDLVLVPGVAFDARGGRLGHGAGFYDRLLGSSAGRPYMVAGAYETQMIEEVPVDRHDVLMNLVATESEFYPPRQEGPTMRGD